MINYFIILISIICCEYYFVFIIHSKSVKLCHYLSNNAILKFLFVLKNWNKIYSIPK